MAHREPKSYSVLIRTSPYQSVLHSPHPVHCAMRSASQWECALLFGESHAHGARGNPYFSPVTPFRPACCIEACGTQCGGMVPLPCGRLSGLRPLEPPASALLRRDKPGTETKWRCRCTTAGATRPLRARHRRASPRVLEFAQECSAQQYRHCLPSFLR